MLNSGDRVLSCGLLTQTGAATTELPFVLMCYVCKNGRWPGWERNPPTPRSGDTDPIGNPRHHPPPHPNPHPHSDHLPQFLEDESGECRSWILGAGGHMEVCKVVFPGRGPPPPSSCSHTPHPSRTPPVPQPALLKLHGNVALTRMLSFKFKKKKKSL